MLIIISLPDPDMIQTAAAVISAVGTVFMCFKK